MDAIPTPDDCVPLHLLQGGIPRRHFRRIAAKSIDFVVCRANTLEYFIAIELDDVSHDRRDRRKRDRLVEHTLREAGLELLRVPASGRYDYRDLRLRLFRQG